VIGTDVVLQVILSGLLTGCVYALIAIGFTLVFGVTEIVNFAHGHLVMVAMFAGYVLFRFAGMDPFVSLLVVLPAFFLLGMALYWLVIDRIVEAPHFAHMMVTLGVLIFLENLMNFFFGGDLRGVTTSYTTASLPLGGVAVPVARAAAAGTSLLAVAVLALFLRLSRYGRAIRAAANNRMAAQLVGIDVRRVYMVSFAIGTAVVALAGVVMLPFSLVSPFVGDEFMLKAFVIAIVGGLGSVTGALAGGVLIGLVEALTGLFLVASLGNAIVFGILILVLFFRPAGLLRRAGE
jgi:branched-chain amino acid transport system permease protein